MLRIPVQEAGLKLRESGQLWDTFHNVMHHCIVFPAQISMLKFKTSSIRVLKNLVNKMYRTIFTDSKIFFSLPKAVLGKRELVRSEYILR